MASKSIHSLYNHHSHHSLHRRHSIDCPPSSLHLKPSAITKTTIIDSASLSQHFSSIAFSSLSSSVSVTSSTSQTISIEILRQHLSSKNFREADEETRRLLILLAGESAQKRGYVFFSEVKFISETDLKAIDELWRQHSEGKFGYSVQKKIWNKSKKDFTKFFLKVRWMKKLESTEIEQYNYRSFPNEFIWELDEGTPEGHLPLTNALRGTQLLNSILTHPAFQEEEEEDGEIDETVGRNASENGGLRTNGLSGTNSKPLNQKVFKSDYSF